MTLLKRINVTNPRNVIVQIPSFVVAAWQLTPEHKLEVMYNSDEKTIIIKPAEPTV